MIDGEKVSDTVGKVNDEVAVGEDLRFQERWWIVERALWVVFLLVIAAGVSGILGRGGVFSRGYFAAPDGSCTVEYERVAHFGTPLRLILHFNPAGSSSTISPSGWVAKARGSSAFRGASRRQQTQYWTTMARPCCFPQLSSTATWFS